MADLYSRRVMNDPEVRLSFSDPLIPIVSPGEVSLEFENSDGYFDDLDLRGERVTYSRFDKLSDETWAELTGIVIDQQTRADRVVLRTMSQTLDSLSTKIPKLTVTAATFPLADPQQGLGKPIPIVFGNAASTNKATDAWELPYVGENTGSNYYDYLVGHGTFTSVTVYRNTYGDTLFEVPGSEYTVNTSAYPGYTVIRFVLRQASHGGGMHRIFAAANCSSTTRNPVTAIKLLLNDSTYGLGESINATSFTNGATAIDTIGGLYCDGVITEQKSAIDYLNQLLIFRGIILDKNSDGEWTVTVDTEQTTIRGRFGHGDGQQWANVADFTRIEKTSVNQAVKTLVLDYRLDRWMDRPVLSTTARSVLAFGEERRIENQFIRDRTTADTVACYIANRLFYEDDSLPFTAGQEARKLRPGEIITYHSIRPAFHRYFRVVDLTRRLTTTAMRAVGWDSRIYTYTAATLPAEPAAVTQTDYSRQTPTAVSSLSVSASGVEQNDQGANVAYVVLQYTVPAESWAYTLCRYTKDGETIWTTLPGENGSGVKTTKITGLTGSQVYDLRVTRVNVANSTLTADADLANQTAPGDTGAPSTPSAIAVRQAGAKVVEIDVTFTAPSDWGTTILYRNTTNNSGTATEIERGKKKRFHDQKDLSYGSTYYYWAKVADRTGNLSGFSPSSSHSLTIAQIVTGDVGDDQITTPKVPVGAITASGVYTNDSGSTLGSSEAEIGTITITCEANQPLAIFGYAGLTKTSNPGGVLMKIRKGTTSGTILGQGRSELVAGGDDTMCVIGYDATPAASQTYKLTAYYDGSAGGSYYDVRLMPVNLKR